MGRLFIAYLESGRIYVCTQCRTHIAECAEIASKVHDLPANSCRLFMADMERLI